MWYLVTLFLALPAFAANMAPVIAARLKWLPNYATPIHEKHLGAHKTWRGVIVAVAAGVIVGAIQYAFFAPRTAGWVYFILFGALSGLGAMVGDAVKSYFKRKIGIAPGKPFIPFDYFDYIIGVVIFTYPLYPWGLDQVLFLILFVCIANPLINMIGYALGIKKTYW